MDEQPYTEEELKKWYEMYKNSASWDKYDRPSGETLARHFDPKWYAGAGGMISDMSTAKRNAKSDERYDLSLREILAKNLPWVAESRHGEKVMVATVLRYVDGDTIELAEHDQDGKPIEVRFMGVDTPETVKAGVKTQFMGKEASAMTKKKFKPGMKVRVRSDVVNTLTDRYGRITAYVEYLPPQAEFLFSIPWLKNRVPAVDYNKSMLAAAVARYTVTFPITRQEEYLAVARAQEELGIGVYDSPGRAEFYEKEGYSAKEADDLGPRYGEYDPAKAQASKEDYKRKQKIKKYYNQD